MVMQTLRRLERKLVFERAETAVPELVDDLIARWYRALEDGTPPPNPIDAIGHIIRSGFYLPRSARATDYLDDCHRQGILPDRHRLLLILLPWHDNHPPSTWK